MADGYNSLNTAFYMQSHGIFLTGIGCLQLWHDGKTHYFNNIPKKCLLPATHKIRFRAVSLLALDDCYQVCLTCILNLTYPRGNLSVPQNKLAMLQSVKEREKDGAMDGKEEKQQGNEKPHFLQLGFKLQYLNVSELMRLIWGCHKSLIKATLWSDYTGGRVTKKCPLL